MSERQPIAPAVDEVAAPISPAEHPDSVRIPVRMILIVGSLSIFGPLCIDTYLPALPAIGRDLHSGASEVQASLTACLIGLAIGQLLVGPLSDRLGRRRPLTFGLMFFVLASCGCAFAPNVLVLIALRFMQGLGAAGGLVIGRAVVRDQYTGNAAARFYSSLMLVTALGPILAPQLGAGLLHFGSWRFVFIAFVIAGAILLSVSAIWLPETLPPDERHKGSVFTTFSLMGEVVTDRVFLVNALATSFAIGAMFAFVSGSSFALENVYGLTPQEFSLAFAGNAIGLVIFSQINGRLVGRVAPYHLVTIGLAMLSSAAVLLLVFVSTHTFGLAGVLPCTFVMLGSIGLIGPNAQALALANFSHAAGSASALLGMAQFAIGAAVAPLVGLGGSANALPMAIVMAAMGVLAVLVRFALSSGPPPPPVPVELVAASTSAVD